MKTTRIALAAVLGLALAAPAFNPGFAAEPSGGANADMLKAPRNKDRQNAHTPGAPGAPSTKPESPKIIFF